MVASHVVASHVVASHAVASHLVACHVVACHVVASNVVATHVWLLTWWLPVLASHVVASRSSHVLTLLSGKSASTDPRWWSLSPELKVRFKKIFFLSLDFIYCSSVVA